MRVECVQRMSHHVEDVQRPSAGHPCCLPLLPDCHCHRSHALFAIITITIAIAIVMNHVVESWLQLLSSPAGMPPKKARRSSKKRKWEQYCIFSSASLGEQGQPAKDLEAGSDGPQPPGDVGSATAASAGAGRQPPGDEGSATVSSSRRGPLGGPLGGAGAVPQPFGDVGGATAASGRASPQPPSDVGSATAVSGSAGPELSGAVGSSSAASFRGPQPPRDVRVSSARVRAAALARTQRLRLQQWQGGSLVQKSARETLAYHDTNTRRRRRVPNDSDSDQYGRSGTKSWSLGAVCASTWSRTWQPMQASVCGKDVRHGKRLARDLTVATILHWNSGLVQDGREEAEEEARRDSLRLTVGAAEGQQCRGRGSAVK